MELNCLNYTIYFGVNAYDKLIEYIEDTSNAISKIFVLTDENTITHCYPHLMKQTLMTDIEVLEIDSGEINKTIDTCISLWETLVELGADRHSLLINLGGGVITDMGGFIASTFMRGIRFINIPTTLLSQVDASVGAKTGIDLGKKKNLIGTFSQPEMVIIDTTYLQTLEQRQLKSGFAEMLKHGLIQDKLHWETLIYSYNNLDFDVLQNLIYDSVVIKKNVVDADPKEKGLRKILNFGHSIGHGLESSLLNTPNELLHGEAIAIGMITEAYLAVKHTQTNLSFEECETIKTEFLKIFPKIKQENINISTIKEYMAFDKKNQKGIIQMALITSIGNCTYNCEVQLDTLEEAFNYYFN